MKTVLFLCSGNTCRSPMAACLFNHLCQQRGLPLRAVSAGASASDGSPASDGAYAAMKARGLSLLGHRAQRLNEQSLEGVSLVMAMSPAHAEWCGQRFPGLSIPVRSFAPAIPDPYGGSVSLYSQTASALDAQLSQLANELSATSPRG